jgi:hypothetical protein
MGIDFIDTPQVVVRFSTRKGAVDVTGTYKSDELIECETPDFSNFGPGEVDVRVSLRGDSFTTTYQKYSFFAVTDASKSVAFGPGLLEGAAAGTECKFVVVSRDTSGQDRTSGGDQFQIQLKNKDNGMMPTADVQDNDDGTYTVSFTPDAVPTKSTLCLKEHSMVLQVTSSEAPSKLNLKMEPIPRTIQ